MSGVRGSTAQLSEHSGASFGTFDMPSPHAQEPAQEGKDEGSAPADAVRKSANDESDSGSENGFGDEWRGRSALEEAENIGSNVAALQAEYQRRAGEGEHPQSRPIAFCATLCCSIRNSLLDYLAIWVVFVRYFITLDTLLYMIIATGATLFYYYYDSGRLASGEISWTFISFAIIFPISYNIGEAYRRREVGLKELAAFKSLVTSTYMAHAHWNFGKDPSNWGWREKVRGGPWDEHTKQVRTVLVDLVGHVRDFLMLPCVNNLRHVHTSTGRKEKNRVMRMWRAEIAHIELCFNRLSLATEITKAYGLPGNEAARINQYLMLMQTHFSAVRYIKGYRTAQGIQSYARLFIFLHPLLYGSYYAYLGLQISLGWALAFSYLLGFSMIGLVNVELALEDPFQTNGLDRIRIEKIAKELMRDLRSDAKDRQAVVEEKVDLFEAEFSLLE
ncbi:hypothetical protein FVE85_4775 [Porphyridium purpureum]|uniref:Uncharacterized protein n=1 Tax=Porphyridium purpureum TaxID=35688 RepID=A0A5J4YQN7_PORPP|nr:hypothetical protein FVE85_4775 [Porphyridium purpureum]|eukprot:POR9585..scf236_6